MSDKIYEFKDDHNWFIGRWDGFNLIGRMFRGHSDDLMRLSHALENLVESPRLDESSDCDSKGYDVSVLKYDNPFLLMSFVIDMINQEMGRQLTITQHQGAVLVTEGDKLVLVHLPEGGVSKTAFFGKEDQALAVGDTILIATKNEGKTKEFRQMFASLGIAVENLNDYPDLPDVAETGTTFEENARLKAETIAELTGRMVLADDSGLKVDVLGGLPGVWSARFSGPDATDAKNNAKLLHELAMVFDLKNRSAQFHSTLVVAKPDKESLVVDADWHGYIGFDVKGEGGFGYDPLFLVGETGRSAAELSAEEKNAISHRGLALQKLMKEFPTWLATN